MITLDMMPPLMFGGLVLFMLVGYPVAFSLAALGIAFGFVAIDHGFFTISYLQAIPGRVFGNVLSNDLLLAVPFFTFMGAILERCGLAEDMLDSMGQLFGPIRGGLGYSVIIVGFILGAITGTVAAQVIAMALISMPVMIRYKYNIRYTTGVLAASGTITQLVPPSLVLIVLADQLGKSVGDMYLGAWGPSVIQIALFALYTFALSILKPEWVPAVPKEARTLTGWALWKKCLMGIVPSAVLIFVVLGTMMLGLTTPTEAGAMGAVGAIVLAVIHHQQFSQTGKKIFLLGIAATGVAMIVGLSGVSSTLFRVAMSVLYLAVAWLCIEAARIPDLRDLIRQGYQTTMRITAMVIFILIGSTCFSIVFLGVDGSRWLEHMLSSLPGGAWGFLAFINLFIFFLAFFLDFFEIAFIILPMIAPAAQKMLTPDRRRRCRADLVRRDAVREHADVVHAPAVRLRAVLSARCRTAFGEQRRHLLGCAAVGGAAAHHGGAGDRLPGAGHRPAGCAVHHRSEQDQDRHPVTGLGRAAAPGDLSDDAEVARVESLIGHGGIEALIALGQVVFINVVLSADNAVVIGMAAMGLAAKDRLRVLWLGIALATLLRIGFAVVATKLLKVLGLLLAGGVLLLWVAWRLWRELRRTADAGPGCRCGRGARDEDARPCAVADRRGRRVDVARQRAGGGRRGDRPAGDHGGGAGDLGAADGRRGRGRRAAARALSLDRLCRAGDHPVHRGEDGVARDAGHRRSGGFPLGIRAILTT